MKTQLMSFPFLHQTFITFPSTSLSSSTSYSTTFIQKSKKLNSKRKKKPSANNFLHYTLAIFLLNSSSTIKSSIIININNYSSCNIIKTPPLFRMKFENESKPKTQIELTTSGIERNFKLQFRSGNRHQWM